MVVPGMGAGAEGRGIQKRTKLVQILGAISDLPGIAQASLEHHSLAELMFKSPPFNLIV